MPTIVKSKKHPLTRLIRYCALAQIPGERGGSRRGLKTTKAIKNAVVDEIQIHVPTVTGACTTLSLVPLLMTLVINEPIQIKEGMEVKVVVLTDQ